MSDAANASDPTTQPAPSGAGTDKPSRSARLLGLVRKLIEYGKELVTTVRQRVATEPSFARCAFGTSDIALILARIARGLHLANALEARLVGCTARLDAPPRPQAASVQRERKPRSPPPPREAAPPDSDGSPSLARMPSPEQIAAEVRRRPIGAVIADICRDLGILPRHPLWREIQDAIFSYGGNYARLVMDCLDRAFPLPTKAELRAILAAPAGTGPPGSGGFAP